MSWSCWAGGRARWVGSSSPWQERLNPASCTTADTTNQPRPLSSEPPHSLRILLNTALGSPSRAGVRNEDYLHPRPSLIWRWWYRGPEWRAFTVSTLQAELGLGPGLPASHSVFFALHQAPCWAHPGAQGLSGKATWSSCGHCGRHGPFPPPGSILGLLKLLLLSGDVSGSFLSLQGLSKPRWYLLQMEIYCGISCFVQPYLCRCFCIFSIKK